MKPSKRKFNMFITNLGGLVFLHRLGPLEVGCISGRHGVVDEPMFAALLTLPAWLGKLAVPIGLLLARPWDYLLRLFSLNREI